MTPKMLNTALPTIVPIPKSLLVTKVPMILVNNSGALVPKKNEKNKAFFLQIINISLLKGISFFPPFLRKCQVLNISMSFKSLLGNTIFGIDGFKEHGKSFLKL